MHKSLKSSLISRCPQSDPRHTSTPVPGVCQELSLPPIHWNRERPLCMQDSYLLRIGSSLRALSVTFHTKVHHQCLALPLIYIIQRAQRLMSDRSLGLEVTTMKAWSGLFFFFLVAVSLKIWTYNLVFIYSLFKFTFYPCCNPFTCAWEFFDCVALEGFIWYNICKRWLF